MSDVYFAIPAADVVNFRKQDFTRPVVIPGSPGHWVLRSAISYDAQTGYRTFWAERSYGAQSGCRFKPKWPKEK